jgi:hypothetical protein
MNFNRTGAFRVYIASSGFKGLRATSADVHGRTFGNQGLRNRKSQAAPTTGDKNILSLQCIGTENVLYHEGAPPLMSGYGKTSTSSQNFGLISYSVPKLG